MRLAMKDRQSVTKALCGQYRRASKKAKGAILDQFVEATGHDQCYARRLLRTYGQRTAAVSVRAVVKAAQEQPRRGRRRKYGPEVLGPLKKLWEMLDYLCGKRLQPGLPGLIERLEACGELRLKKGVRKKLLELSPATIDRLLANERKKHALKAKSRTKPGTLLKHQISVRTFADWDNARPGFLEIDLVGHDGGSTRARPYCKNDTCYVEQKNWSIVRRFVGYARFESPKACEVLNELYLVLADYNNYFLPSMKLQEKTRHGARVHKRYDTAKTPLPTPARFP